MGVVSVLRAHVCSGMRVPSCCLSPCRLPHRPPHPHLSPPQHDAGAQVVQIFDSWAAQLSPSDFDVWCGPYLRYIITEAKKVRGWPDAQMCAQPCSRLCLPDYLPTLLPTLPPTTHFHHHHHHHLRRPPLQQCPDLPIILYISNSGALVERMAACQPDIISLCHTVDLKEGVARAGTQFAYQGNMDSGVLFGSHEMIEQRVRETAAAAKAAGVRHVMNLGHGVMQVGASVRVHWVVVGVCGFIGCLWLHACIW